MMEDPDRAVDGAPPVGIAAQEPPEGERSILYAASNMIDDAVGDDLLDAVGTKSTTTKSPSRNEEDTSRGSELKQHKLGLDINNPWGWSGSSFDDYDVITVHGIRDDYKTAWTDKEGDWWVKNQLFEGLAIRQIDYSYETNEESTIYQANGINLHAEWLIREYAEVRKRLEETETDRPVIWICHDLGGMVVKAALTMAMANTFKYGKIAVLTTAIIFLGTPHRFQSFDHLKDQILKLVLLPGPDITDRVLEKVHNLAHQIDSVNQLFPATKICDRAVIVNVFTQNSRDSLKHKAIGDDAITTTEIENADELPDPSFAFPRYAYLSGHSFEAYGRYRLNDMNHLGLVQGDQTSDNGWVGFMKDLFNVNGSTIQVDHRIIQFQARLLSLVPPTRTIDTLFDPVLPKPPILTWTYKQPPYTAFSKKGNGPRVLHLHGDGSSLVNISELSRLIYTHYDSDVDAPSETAIYFEFDRWDSRYSTISSMLIYFINALLWRFCVGFAPFITGEMSFFKVGCWSLANLYHLYTILRDHAPGAHELTFFIGCFDQCPENQRQWFLEHVLEDQSYSETEYRIILSTSNSDGLAVRSFPNEARINLSHCPAVGESNDRLTRELQSGLTSLIASRPVYEDFQLQLESLLKECDDAPYLGHVILTWLRNHHRGKPKSEIADNINKLFPVTAENVVQILVCSLQPELRSRASNVFNWVKHASEPWSPEALIEALAVHESNDEEPSLNDLDIKSTMSDIEAAFAGVIITKNRNVKFSHPSFYNLPEVGIEGAIEEWASKVNSTIAVICLRYFQLKVVQDRLEDFCLENLEGGPWATPLDTAIIYYSRLSMAEYAIRFWPHHYRDSGQFKPNDLVNDLFASRESRAAWQIPFWLLSNTYTRLKLSYVSTLPVLAMLGLEDLIEEKVKSEMGRPSFQKDCWFAITEAARVGSEKIVQQLLRLVTIDEEQLRIALLRAVSNNNAAVVDALLVKIPDLKSFQWFQWSNDIILRAAMSGLDNILYAVLQSNCDIDTTGGYCQALCAVTVWYDHVPTMKILLDSKLKPDLTLVNEGGSTLLMHAIRRGNPHMINLLLRYGASIDEENNRMLETALRSSKHKAVEIIIKAKPDLVNVSLPTLGPPLVAAADFNLRECVLVLLKNGADPNIKGATESALYKAVARNHQDIARILLEHEPKPDMDVTPPDAPLLIIQAICTGNTELVSLLIKHSARINIVDPNSGGLHKTPLSWACFRGDLDMVKLLLRNQADINYTGGTSDPPLFTALYNHHEKVADYLLQDNSIDVSWTASDGWNSLHAAFDQPNSIRRILKMGVSIESQCNSGTLLHIVAREGHSESIEVLLENDPKPEVDRVYGNNGNVKGEVGCTALQLACLHHHPECVRILQKAGANTRLKNQNGHDAIDILLAINTDSNDVGECLEILLSSTAIDQVNEQGQSRLHGIQAKTPVSIVQLLVGAKAPLDTQDQDGYTPLAIAVRKGNESVAKYLIEQGARVNVFGARFGSILHIAVANGYIDMVKMLVKSGADCGTVHREYGESLLYTALCIEDDYNLEQLVHYLVDEVSVPINQLGGKLAYPIIVAAEMTRIKHASGLRILKYLIERKAQVDVADSQGRRAVHFACASHDDDGLKALVDASADIEARDKLGRKPIHFAAAASSTNCFDFLLGRLDDADGVNTTDLDNWTPLLWAARSGDWDIVSKLVAQGADVWVRGRTYGMEWSALKLANFADRNPPARSELEPKERTRLNQDGIREHWDDSFHEILAGHKKDTLCQSCLVIIIGIQWKCIECTSDFSLCFKCYSYRSDVHDPEHIFDEIEPQYDENMLSDHASSSSDTDEQATPDAPKRDKGKQPQDRVDDDDDEAQSPVGSSDEGESDLDAFLADGDD
ncbi:putative ankyrin repeat protein [Xylaria cubensis]|nr:putative ankyrin repeat protein [Xylaria cubensis]